ncbi:MAG TPA: prolyl aminopeptidase [Legionella sp.]|nr:prolyl aminopeptidase [Legionella sp.]
MQSQLYMPFNQNFIQVSPLHELWYAEYGNPKGIPVIVLHGGPGAGCSETDVTFFDLKFWRIILLDQRGSNRSKPFGEMKENTTQYLVSDLELLREKLNIDKWLVFGGSWGSTLALCYGECHPEHVLGFILRGIFLARKKDNWHFWYGMRNTFPDAWQELSEFVPESERHDLIAYYNKQLSSSDHTIAIQAARSFIKYDLTSSFLQISASQLNELMTNEKFILGLSRTFVHYSINNFFLAENQLISNICKINHLPLIIIHGRYDMISPVINAYDVHKLWEGSEFYLVEVAGHSAAESAITQRLMQATEKMKKLIDNVALL